MVGIQYYEIFTNNDESMGIPSGSVIATDVNFDRPFQRCCQLLMKGEGIPPPPLGLRKRGGGGFQK